MKNNPFRYISTLIIVFSLFFLIGCDKFPSGRRNVPSTKGFPEQTVPVEKVVIQESVTASGNIQPMQVRELGFSTDGKITAVSIAEGDFVTEGTILAKIDASADEYNIEEMEYELEEMRFSESPRRIALKERKLESLKETLKNKIISAPFDGVVVEIKHKEGEINITGSDGYLIKIIDDSKLKADVLIDELDIARIRVGQKAVFSFDAVQGKNLWGGFPGSRISAALMKTGFPL